MSHVDFGTDCGPACWRCKGTIWAYTFTVSRKALVASCVGCKAVEGPIPFRPYTEAELTANLARVAHTRFLEHAELHAPHGEEGEGSR